VTAFDAQETTALLPSKPKQEMNLKNFSTLATLKKYLTFSNLQTCIILIITLIGAFLFFSKYEDHHSEEFLVAVSNGFPVVRELGPDMSKMVGAHLVVGPQESALHNHSWIFVFNLSFAGKLHGSDDWIPIHTVHARQRADRGVFQKRWTIDLADPQLNLTEFHHFDHYAAILSVDHEEPIGVLFSAASLPEAARYRVVLAFLVLIFLYVMIVFEWVHPGLAVMLADLLGLGLLAHLQQRPSFELVVTFIDFETITLLFGMMIMVGIFSTTGFFEWAGVKAYKYSGGNIWNLLVILSILTAVVSAGLDNVTTVLLVVPLTIKICRALDIDPKLLLLSEVMFSNLGGTVTIIGDPPNIIIANHPVVKKVVSFIQFTAHVLPGGILACVGIFFWVRRYAPQLVRKTNVNLQLDLAIWKRTLKKFSRPTNEGEENVRNGLAAYVAELEQEVKDQDIKNDPVCSVAELEAKYPIKDQRLFLISSMILTVVMLLFFSHSFLPLDVNLAWIAVIGAMFHLSLAHLELDEILEKVEWSALLFFAGLFIFVRCLTDLGLITWIADNLSLGIAIVPEGKGRLATAITLLLWGSGLASALVGSIPSAATLIGVVVNLAGPEGTLGLPLTPLVWALVFGACFGGNGTIIAAAANVVCVGIADSNGIHISFVEFTKVGMPITAISLLLANIYLLLFHVVIPWW